MLILPLPAKPDWRTPPWITLLLITACCVVYFGFQHSDDALEQQAAVFYMESGLAETELPRYLADLETRGEHELAAKLKPDLASLGKSTDWATILFAMQEDQEFMARLHNAKVVQPHESVFDRWSKDRRQFDAIWNRIFTVRYALHPRSPEVLQVFMQLFMHADITHLLGNMAILFIVAYTVEDLLGPWCFLLFYLLAGLGASVPDLLWPGEPGSLSLGASGAISGVTAMFVMLYGLRRIRFFYWIVFYFNTMRAPALLILPYWIGNELWHKLADEGSHVNYMAHFAGLLSGALLIALYRQLRSGRSAEKVEREDAANKLEQQRVTADDYLRRLEFGRAARAYAALVNDYPGNTDLVLRGFRAASMQPDNPLLQNAINTLFTLDRTLLQSYPAETAKAWLLSQQRQLKLPALSVKIWVALATTWVDAGLFEATALLLPRLLARDQGFEEALSALLYRLGLRQQKAGNEKEAKLAWDTLVKRYPKSSEVRQLLSTRPPSGGTRY